MFSLPRTQSLTPRCCYYALLSGFTQDGLIPFTRWITPPNMPKRFTAQMYLYMLPELDQGDSSAVEEGIAEAQAGAGLPTNDGGVEIASATFEHAETWLARARRNEIILFPPQMYLLSLVAPFLAATTSPSQQRVSHASDDDRSLHRQQRQRLLDFVFRASPAAEHGSTASTFANMAISPRPLRQLDDGRVVLGLDMPGPELRGSGRKWRPAAGRRR